MKNRLIIALGISVILFHAALAASSLMAFLEMGEENIDKMLIAAEGHFYFRDQALFDTITFALLGVWWIALILFFKSGSVKSMFKSLSVAVLAALGIAAIALFGEGIADLGVYPIVIGVFPAIIRYQKKRSAEKEANWKLL